MKVINRYKANSDKFYSIKLNSNESYKGVEGEYIQEVLNEVRDKKLNRYPDSDCKILKECYAKVIGLKSENIIVGNGSDEMIALVINAVISKGKTVLTLEPDFSMYDFYTAANEGKIIKFKTNKDGSFSVQDFINMALDIVPELIIFSNPNNPTGYALNIREISRIVESLPRCKILIDEAYYEYYGQTVVNLINNYSNLIVTRTLSKAWGLAALRVGFLVANKNLVRELGRYKVPYNVNEISQNIAAIMLQYPERTLNNVMELVEERERFYNMLSSLESNHNGKIRFYKSKANFIFGRSPFLRYIKIYMENQGILLRYFKDDSFRITVGNQLENDLVVTIINNALDEMEDDDERKIWGNQSKY